MQRYSFVLVMTCAASAHAGIFMADETHSRTVTARASDATGMHSPAPISSFGPAGVSTHAAHSPADVWSSMSKAEGSHAETFVGATTFTHTYAGSGRAEAGATGIEPHIGDAMSSAHQEFRVTTIGATSSTDALHIAGTLAITGTNPMNTARILFKARDSDARLLDHEITSGSVDFALTIPLEVGKAYELLVIAHASAAGDHTNVSVGIPPTGGHVTYDFIATAVPSPAGCALLFTSALVSRRRRR